MSNWYGIPGIEFHWKGNTEDALVEYKGMTLAESVLGDTMWERFIEDGNEEDFDAFGAYMREHAEDVYELFELTTLV